MNSEACIVLANGQIFRGRSFGASGVVAGETVFTTGMTGYLEALTDPSYYGQIVVQTFPLIGNYGVIEPDFESAGLHLRGYIVRDLCERPSNFRCGGVLNSLLEKNKIIGLCGIDTRRLTKILREAGVMNGMLVAGDSAEALEIRGILENPARAAERDALLEKIRAYQIVDAVRSVAGNSAKIEKPADVVFRTSAEYNAVPVTKDGLKVGDAESAMKGGRGKKVVLWDFGAKANIRRELLKRGVEVETVAGAASAEEILSHNPDGIMLSNGPGDPQENGGIIAEIRTLCESGVPIFGICLGHQLLALARGAATSKLKYGHRGANQPVKQISSGRVYISSQNHGYAVETSSLPAEAALSFVNANDGTCEGVTYMDIPAFSVQFHPEAAAGPLDLNFLFDDFISLINDRDYFRRPKNGA